MLIYTVWQMSMMNFAHLENRHTLDLDSDVGPKENIVNKETMLLRFGHVVSYICTGK